MKLLTITILLVLGLAFRSCGRKPEAGKSRTIEQATGQSDSDAEQEGKDEESEEAEKQPDPGDIGEDCVAFVRSTKVAVQKPNDGSCPQCPVADESAEVLHFDNMKIDKIAPAGDTCEVDVTILATFRSSRGGVIGGGLTGWISPEERAKYERGETPAGQRTFSVHITYSRKPDGWQPIEFNRATP